MPPGEIVAGCSNSQKNNNQTHQDGIFEDKPEADGRYQPGEKKRRETAERCKCRATDTDSHEGSAEPGRLGILVHGGASVPSNYLSACLAGSALNPDLLIASRSCFS